jgi:hypothetical protein
LRAASGSSVPVPFPFPFPCSCSCSFPSVAGSLVSLWLIFSGLR